MRSAEVAGVRRWAPMMIYVLFGLLSLVLLEVSHRRAVGEVHRAVAMVDNLTQARVQVMQAYLGLERLAQGDPTSDPSVPLAALNRAVDELDDLRAGRTSLLAVSDGVPLRDQRLIAANEQYSNSVAALRSRIRADGLLDPVQRRIAFVILEARALDLERLLYGGLQGSLEREVRMRRAWLTAWTGFLSLTGVGLLLLMNRSRRTDEQRKQAENLLFRREARFRSLIEHVPGLILLVDADRRIHYASPSTTRVLGYAPEQLESTDVVDLVHPGDREASQSTLARVADEPRRTASMAFRYRHLGGDWRVLESTVVNLLEDPSVEAMVLNARDVTDRVQAVEDLRQSEERFRQLAEAVDQVFILRDDAGRFLYVSPAYEKLLGRPRESLFADPGSWTDAIHADDRDRVSARMNRRPKGLYDVEYRIVLPGGEVHWVRDRGFPVTDERGILHRRVSIVEDVTRERRAQQTVAHQAEMFDRASLAGGVALWEWDLRIGTLEWSGWAHSMLGYPPGVLPVTTEAWESLIHPEDRERVLLAVEGHLADDRPYDQEYRVRKRDGSVIWWRDVGKCRRNEDGTPFQMSGSVRDVTERHSAEEALRQSEERLRLHFEQTALAVIEWDTLFRVTKWNPAAVRIFGFSRAEAVGRHAAFIVPERARSEVTGVWRALLEQGGGERSTNENLTKDGAAILCEWFNTPLTSGDGTVIGVASLVLDVTERKNAEERLAESLSVLRATLDSTRAGMLVVGRDGQVTIYSRRFQEMWRIPDSVLGTGSARRVTDVLVGLLTDPDSFVAREMELERSGELESEDRFALKDGRVFECYSSPYRLGQEIAGRVWSWHDVTARQNLEMQFRHAQKMEAVGRLAGGIAHDFNNALNIIGGIAQLLLLDAPPDGSLREDLEEIDNSVRRTAGLTRQLLALSRRQLLEPEVLDLNDVVRATEKILRRVLGEDVELRTELDPCLGSVLADPGQIEQILMNLAINARDAMPRGGILLTRTENVEVPSNWTAAPSGEPLSPGAYVVLAVRDTGEGMTDDVRERIFEPFFTTKETGKGTGLGLSTVYGIVQQSGGSIAVDSAPGEGTTFRIYLPRLEDAVEARIDREEKKAPVAVPLKSGAILLVEDDAAMRRVSRRVLERAGYQVLEAEDGEEALGLLEAHAGQVRLLVTDVIMPKMGGLELIERLQESDTGIAILLTSGYTDVDVSLQPGGRVGSGIEFLQKPYGPHALAAKVAAMFGAEPPPEA